MNLIRWIFFVSISFLLVACVAVATPHPKQAYTPTAAATESSFFHMPTSGRLVTEQGQMIRLVDGSFVPVTNTWASITYPVSMTLNETVEITAVVSNNTAQRWPWCTIMVWDEGDARNVIHSPEADHMEGLFAGIVVDSMDQQVIDVEKTANGSIRFETGPIGGNETRSVRLRMKATDTGKFLGGFSMNFSSGKFGTGGDSTDYFVHLFAVSVSGDQTSLAPAIAPAPEVQFPLAWPTTPLTEQQILSVKNCDVEKLAHDRYLDSVTRRELLEVYTPASDCDWAVLALEYSKRMGNGSPEWMQESARNAFAQAIQHNLGFALSTSLFYQYFGRIPLVKAPPFTQQDITEIRINYKWGGLGNKVNYSLEIQQANGNPIVRIEPRGISPSANSKIDKGLVQALAPALTDLVPVKSKFSLAPCTDNYPSWVVTLIFADKTKVDLTTDSNFLHSGGPWFTEINRQTYVQLSPAFAQAVTKLAQSMDLPFGQPAGMTCRGASVFEKAFP